MDNRAAKTVGRWRWAGARRVARSLGAALALGALALIVQGALGGPFAQAAAMQHILPSGCQARGNVSCAFDLHPAGEIVVGPTTHGSGQVAIEAVQAPTEVYLDVVDIMREAKPGASKAWIALRHRDSKNKYVLLLKNRRQVQFIVEKAGRNYTLATVPYVVALNDDLSIELDATGYTFTAYDVRGGARRLLFSVTDHVGMIPAGNGDSMDLYVNQGTQACWDELAGRPA